jgi:hypothetical protein
MARVPNLARLTDPLNAMFQTQTRLSHVAKLSRVIE